MVSLSWTLFVIAGVAEIATSWVFLRNPGISRRHLFTSWTLAAWMMLIAVSSLLEWVSGLTSLTVAAVVLVVPSVGLATLNYWTVIIVREQERQRRKRWFSSSHFLEVARGNYIIAEEARRHPDLVPDDVWRELFSEPKPEPMSGEIGGE